MISRHTILILPSLSIIMSLMIVLPACTSRNTNENKLETHFQKGYNAYKSGDFYTAFLYFEPLAEAGNPAAQLLMATMYANGQGVKPNIQKAEHLRMLAGEMINQRDGPLPISGPEESTLKDVEQQFDALTSGAAGDEKDSSPNTKDLQEEKPEHVTESSFVSTQDASLKSSPIPTVTDPEKKAAGRDVNQITLATLRQKTELGDWESARLLALAYAEGYFGLKPNRAMAKVWEKRASALRHARFNLYPPPATLLTRKQMRMCAMLLVMGISTLAVMTRKKRRTAQGIA